ncbi:hypothetical protein GCM10028857_15510 [Salinarchaeum chitinilyticum]
MSPSTKRPVTAPPKATLICPACGHESNVDGDWIHEVHTEFTDYECPECGETIASRPERSEPPTRSSGAVQCCCTD